MRTLLALAVIGLYYLMVYAAALIGIALIVWGVVMRRSPAIASDTATITPQEEGRNLIVLGLATVAIGLAFSAWHFLA